MKYTYSIHDYALDGLPQFHEQPTKNMSEIAYIARIAREKGIPFDEARKQYDIDHPTKLKRQIGRACRMCGSAFEPYHKKQKYCSDICRAAAKRKPSEPNICPICGSPKKETAKTCGKGCAGQYAWATRRTRGNSKHFDIELFVECYNKGMVDSEIAKAMSRAKGTVVTRRSKYELPPNGGRGGNTTRRINHGVKASLEVLLDIEGVEDF